jgi:hypothetical protein
VFISWVEIFLLLTIAVAVLVQKKNRTGKFQYVRVAALMSFLSAVVLYSLNTLLFQNDVPIEHYYFSITVVIHMLITYFFCSYVFYYLLPFLLKGPLAGFKEGLLRIQSNRFSCNIILLLFTIIIHIGHIGAVVLAIWRKYLMRT